MAILLTDKILQLFLNSTIAGKKT